MTPIAHYLKSLEIALKAGNATEHTHRPAFKMLVEALGESVTATNEPQRIACGSPDFIVTQGSVPLGYIEAKDIGVDLDRAEQSEQLQRYRSSLRNLVLTDYLEFRLYRNGELIQTARLGTWLKGALRRAAAGPAAVETLLRSFFAAEVPTVATPRDLAERMARVARLIHDLIPGVFAKESEKGDLHNQYQAFRRVLIADLTVDQFADMYAQTIAYGLFAARCNHQGSRFSREHAGRELPRTNPFLRRLFNTIAGVDLDNRIAWAVDDLAELLNRADMAAILEDFGKATRQEDPVVHFYETFLAAYDPKLREMRGVYYTPAPVVDYIVRSVDLILRRDFKLRDGLADKSKVSIELPSPRSGKKARKLESHRVQILDPACGTGTFLHAVISAIRDRFEGASGLWPSYVAQHLLPRVYGFELLMAPYAVAHMKLGLQLQETGYDFAADERLRVFLTNSLEEAHEYAGLPLFAQWLADEASAAAEVKRDAPIMVVVGNPPYSGHSVNKGAWIEDLMKAYKRSPELKKPAQAKWLSDDYVKFIRFAQWRIEQTGYGVLGFISNHSYLDNPTFLDMRESVMSTFDEIYVLDLHGSSKKKEIAPDGSNDANVFDIQQGVAICLMVRRGPAIGGSKQIHHADLWGERGEKYEWLAAHDVTSTPWRTFKPLAPRRIFVPQDEQLLAEYEQGWSIADAMDQNGDLAPGIVTTHDQFAISWTREEAEEKIERFLDTHSEEEARANWRLCSQSQWNYARAKEELAAGRWRDLVVPILYRPFDVRWTVYDRNVAVHRRARVMDHLLQSNVALITARSNKAPLPDHFFCSDKPVETKCGESTTQSVTVPLWLYDAHLSNDLFRDAQPTRRANFNPNFTKNLAAAFAREPSSEQVFSYIYAVLYSPAYRARYGAFLKRGFPRVPLCSSHSLFDRLSALGQRLIDLHLMREHASPVPEYPIAGDNRVEHPRFANGRIHINADQYFEGVGEAVWRYQIGGYQVAEKWLKDRKGRLLTFNELDHYRHVLAALHSTIEIQGQIDGLIPGWPLT